MNAQPAETATETAAPPTLADIRRIAREQQATLVQYSLIGQQLYIWVVQPDGRVELRTASLAELETEHSTAPTSLTTWVSQARRALLSRRPQAAARQMRRLHQLLIEPIADLLPTEPTERVIFIPQGTLFLIPFPALQAADGSVLVEKHVLLTAPSIQVLDLTQQQQQQRQARRARRTADTMLLVGNPEMPALPARDDREPKPLSALPGAEAEAKAIGELLAVEPLLGTEATEAAIAPRLGQARWIHLATHGLLNEVQHLGLSIPGAIALAPDQRFSAAQPHNPADGLLTASEIFDLQL